MLEYLADKEDKSEKSINLYTFYNSFVIRTIPPRVTFDQYLGFLESWKFIQITTREDKEKIVKITPHVFRSFILY